ncbi:MAG: S41 family peptidase [Candidatus Obscuribacter sp.]|nr:S41 family peptidase [Candidatus Obscuribacter sp.]
MSTKNSTARLLGKAISLLSRTSLSLALGFTLLFTLPHGQVFADPAQSGKAAVTAPAYNGAPIYKDAFEALRDRHRELRDPAARAKFVAEWENKHAKDGMLNTEAGTDRAIFEMVWSLGQRYDYYNPPVEAKAEADRTNATMAGVGMPVGMKGLVKALKELKQKKDSGVEVKDSDYEALGKISDERPLWVPDDPYEGSPARGAGILKGDIITHVNGKSVNGQTIDEVVSQIRGPAGTKVKVTIKRQSEFADQTKDIEITRAQVQVRVIHSTSLPGNITRIKMDHFSSQFGDQEMADALVAAVSSGTKGIIIDLRGNPGGFLHQVMNIGQMLLKDGIIVQNVARRGDHLVTTTNLVTEKNFIVREESTDGSKTETRYRRNAPVIVPASIPVVVLINEGSASASEILAGALQANGRAIIVGTPTRGKGVGQDLVKFDKGNRNMHVTSFEFRPGGEAMDWVGIVPDVEVKMPEFADVAEDPSADAQLNQAKAEMLNIILGNPAPKRDAAELAKRRDELKKANEEMFAKEVEGRKKFLATPIKDDSAAAPKPDKK